MTTLTQNTVRETLSREHGEYVVGFTKVKKTLDNGSRMCTLIIERDETDAQPEAVTLWLDEGEALPQPKQVIHAFIERTRVTNLANGREYLNADVREFTFA